MYYRYIFDQKNNINVNPIEFISHVDTSHINYLFISNCESDIKTNYNSKLKYLLELNIRDWENVCYTNIMKRKQKLPHLVLDIIQISQIK